MFNRSRRSLVASAVAGLTFLAAAVPAVAQNYPVRPITMIVPWGAGGGTDAVARIVASLLEKDLGQPVTVEGPYGRFELARQDRKVGVFCNVALTSLGDETFFPQFLDPSAAWAPQFAVLASTFVAFEFTVLTLCALGVARLAPVLRSGARMRWFNRISGGLFTLMGTLLLATRRAT